MEKRFTCEYCKYETPESGCIKPTEIPCPYGLPFKEVAENYKRPPKTRQTTLYQSKTT
jgi:hypothetical protein